MNRSISLTIAFAALLVSPTSRADDLQGFNRFLCSSAEVTACFALGECVSMPPWELNVPQFIEVDLVARTLATTEASGENRSTPIKNLERGDGLIFLQGVEAGRAFSFVINEESGQVSVAVAREELAVTVFGACTPLQPSASPPEAD